MSTELAEDELDALETCTDEWLRWCSGRQRLYFRGAAHKLDSLETDDVPFILLECPAGYPDSAKIDFKVNCDSYSPESAALMQQVHEALRAWVDNQDAGEQMAFMLAFELREILMRIADGEKAQEQPGQVEADDDGDEDFDEFPVKLVTLFLEQEFAEALKTAGFKAGRTDHQGKVSVWWYSSETAGEIQLTGQASKCKEYLCSPYDIMLEHDELDKSSCAQFLNFRYKDDAHMDKGQFAKDLGFWAVEQLNNLRDDLVLDDVEDDDDEQASETDLKKNIVGNLPSIKEINSYLASKGIPPVTQEAMEARSLGIYTWGSRFFKTFTCAELKAAGVTKDNNVSTCMLNGSRSGCAENNGTTLKIQKNVACGGNFKSCMLMTIAKVERRELHILGVNCHKGRHRSVAFACLLKEFYYKNAVVDHLTLKRADR